MHVSDVEFDRRGAMRGWFRRKVGTFEPTIGDKCNMSSCVT